MSRIGVLIACVVASVASFGGIIGFGVTNTVVAAGSRCEVAGEQGKTQIKTVYATCGGFIE